MTDAELLDIAASALPRLKGIVGAIVRRGGEPQLESMDIDMKLLDEMQRLLKVNVSPNVPPAADSVDVAFHEDTPIGRRTTVVQIRGGVPTGIIGQA